jgi:hypothetical protein
MRTSIVVAAALASGCTFYHSKQVLHDSTRAAPTRDARFVTEDDAGFALAGFLVLTEPDHYAVLLERARRQHKCATLHHVQVDYYTDHWLLVGFPVTRLTAVCEPEPEPEAP